MNTLRDYVDWKLTHPQGYMSRNLFDKDNVVAVSRYLAKTPTPTENGIAFVTEDACSVTEYPQMSISVCSVSKFRGKTVTLSSPSFAGTAATKIVVLKNTSRIQFGTDWKKWGDVYYSTITVEDREYTDETLGVALYAYGKGAGELVTYEKIMLNEGAEPLPYEPYGKFIKK